MPRQKGSKASGEGDVESKNPLWLKDKGDQFLRERNFLSAVEAYSEAIRLDGRMVAAWANRALCFLRVFDFAGVVRDCDQCLALMQGNIGGG